MKTTPANRDTFLLHSRPSKTTRMSLLPPCETRCVSSGTSCKMGLKREKKRTWRGTTGAGRVLDKRTRESFHLWPINAVEHRRHKSEGLATLDKWSLLPWIRCPVSHTSGGADTLFQQITARHTLGALFNKPRKLPCQRLRKGRRRHLENKEVGDSQNPEPTSANSAFFFIHAFLFGL